MPNTLLLNVHKINFSALQLGLLGLRQYIRTSNDFTKSKMAAN